MKKKQRVPKGEKYWYLYIGSRNITTIEKTDYYNSTDDDYFKSGNYFTSSEEAESMARKLRAVLKGADVIHTPSEEEIEDKVVYYDKLYEAEGLSRYAAAGMADWLIDKIVK